MSASISFSAIWSWVRLFFYLSCLSASLVSISHSSVILLMGLYTDIYNVEDFVKKTARNILIVFAAVSPVKVMNMILGGGIVKSGGKTRIVMIIELFGTWGFGVPLAFLSAYVWKLSISLVYLCLSFEECVRLILTWIIFIRKKWMQKI